MVRGMTNLAPPAGPSPEFERNQSLDISTSPSDGEPLVAPNPSQDEDNNSIAGGADIEEWSAPEDELSVEGGPRGFFDPDKMLLDTEAAHQWATRRNEMDWSHKPSQQATNQHLLDVHFNTRKREIRETRDTLGALLADWVGTPHPDGRPRTERPPIRIWTLLSYEQRRAVDSFLARNARVGDEFVSHWLDAERLGRTTGADLAFFRLRNGVASDAIFLDADIKDNKRQGLAAEKAFIERLRLERARFEQQVRVYIEGTKIYMVADVFISGGGVSHVHIVEIKSGNAVLSEHQVKVIAEAINSGRVYIVSEKKGRSLEPGIKPNVTLSGQGIIPIVTIEGGDQEAIRRQFRNHGLEVLRGGRVRRIRGGARPI